MANLDLARGRSTVLNLTNQTGSTRSPGDVVVLSTANDESFTTSASSNYATTQIGVVDETIGIGSNGRVVVEGYARNVNVGVNTVSRGHWLYQSTSAGIGVGSAINPPIAGAFGQVLKGGTGTEPSAVIIPTLQSSGGGSSASAGSNSMAVGATNQAGVAGTFSPSDHRHMGLHSITSSSSNTLQRPTVNFRAGTNVGLTATDTDGDGTLDTITIHSTGAAAGGGGGGGGGAYEELSAYLIPTYDAVPNTSYQGERGAYNGTAESTGGANSTLSTPGDPDRMDSSLTGNSLGWHRDATDMPNGYVDVKYDLGAARSVYYIHARGFWSNSSALRHPSEFRVYSSSDGSSYTERGTAITGMAADPGTLSPAPWVLVMDLSASPISARYWRVRIWPTNSGGDDWLFISRVRVIGAR